MFFSPVLIAIVAAVSGVDANNSASLTVMTYNLRYGSADDGADAWDIRKDFLVSTIEKHGPDILGTQECLDFQAAYLVEKLSGYASIGLGREEGGAGEMTAVIYKKGRLLPVESGHLWLSETPEIPASKSWDSSLPRMATWVKFYNLATKRYFYFYNTHLDHRGEQARLESARLLLERIRTRGATTPVILTGDFNATAGNAAPYSVLTEGGLLDMWEVAAKQRGVANTWNGFQTPDPAAARRIDWILTTPGVEAAECEIDNVEHGGHYPSDHMPVIAQIVLPD